MHLPHTENLITTREAGEISGYTPDYLARLARAGKITGRRVGHSWLIERVSLESFIANQKNYKIDYARALSLSREAEYRERRAIIRRATRALMDSMPVSRTHAAVIGPLRSQALAVSVALLVIATGAFGARAVTDSRFVLPVAELASEAASGFSATFGNIPSRIIARIEKAGADMRAPSERVATNAANASAEAVSSFLTTDVNLSPLQMAIDDHRTSRITLVSNSPVHAPVAPVAPITVEDAQADALAAYAFVTTPSLVVDTLARAYVAFGADAHDAILVSFSAYRSLIERAGAETLALAATARDALATSPRLVDRVNLAFGTAIIEATHAAIHADVATAYGVATAAPASARVTVALIGGMGGAVALATERAPALAVALYLRATGAPASLAPRMAQAAFGAEYATAARFIALTGFVSRNYLALVEGAGRLAYTGAAGTSTLADGAVSRVARAPAVLENASLGALGRVALALENLTSSGRKSPVFQNPALAAALPPLSAGERAALATYETLSGFMRSATDALALLFSPPTIVLPTPDFKHPALTGAPSLKTPASRPAIINSYPTYTTVVQGVSPDVLNQSLASLRADVLSVAAGMVRPVAAQGVTNMNSIQQVNMIQDLSNLIVRNGDFRGGAFSNGSLTSGISVSAATGNFTNLTGGSFSAGSASLATTTVTGDLSVSGALTVNANETLNGILTVSSFAATSTTATSTIATGGFAIGANQFVVQQTSGRVGIGTTSPTSLLHVGGVGTAKFNGALGIGTTDPRKSDGYGIVTQSDVANGGSSIAVVDRAEWATSIEGYVGTPGFDFYNNTSQALFWLFAQGRLPGLCNSTYVQQQCYSVNLFAQAANGLNIAVTGNALRFLVDSVDANPFRTERMRINAAGNVGIGTTSPYRTLSVAGSGVFTGGDVLASTFTATSSITAPSLTLTGLAVNSLLSTNASGVLTATSTPTFGNFNATSTVATSTISTGGLTVGGSQFVVQQTSGNVGIGTTRPTSLLTVSGHSVTGSDSTKDIELGETWNTSGAPIAIFANITDTASANGSWNNGSSSWVPGGLALEFQRNGSPVFAVHKGGSLYIGRQDGNYPNILLSGLDNQIAMADGRMNLNSSGTAGLVIQSTNLGLWFPSLIFQTAFSSSQAMIQGNGTTLNIRLSDNSGDAGLTAGTIFASGKVGIGTTSPYRTLSVAGSGVFTGGDVLASTFTATSSITAASLSLTTALPVSSGGTGQTTFAGNQLHYGNFAQVATTTLTLSGFPANIPAGYGKLVGGSDTTWTYWGLATSSQPASSNLLVSNGTSGVYGVATTSVTCSGTVSCSSFNILGSSPITITGSGGGGGSDFTFPTVLSAVTAATTSPLAVFNAVYFGATGTTTVTSAGFLGIGTTSPFAQLSLAGAAGGTTNLFAVSTSTAGYATTTALTIDQNGKLSLTNGASLSVSGTATISGAGTTTLAGFLDVNGTGANATSTFAGNLWVKGTLRTGTGSMYLNDAGLTSSDGNIALSRLATSTLGTNGLAVGTSQFVVQQTSGSVGIGTAAPAYALDVTGNIRASSQVRAEVANGTAPLVVNSTTKVVNLNADLLDGLDSSAFGDATAANQTTILSRIGTNADATTTPAAASSVFAALKYISGNTHATSTTFTANGTWTRPSGVNQVWVTMCGGGGSGGTGANSSSGGGGGGGSGQVYQRYPVSVTGNVTVTVGAAGANSSFGSLTASAGSSGSSGVAGAAGGGGSVGGGGGGTGSAAGSAGTGINGGGGGSAGTAGAGGGGGGGTIFGVGGKGGDAGGSVGGAGGSASANTCAGGGGGGASTSASTGAGGGGGSGIVIVEWFE